ncbi:Hypothetical predicted protein [Cloeon dipterum]|uniref:RNA polymerase II-associated protein 3 n=1 Tax=Cloeon dipterum TaxID=197152 RepID=A0A8S1CJU3_9INSE|nr:Hypothetical predicted protein [Cloeon dipterum]
MDPVALQKQIKDNSEDLTKFLGDLKSWQEQIKQKEQALSKGGKDCETEIPPVRSKKNKLTKEVKVEEKVASSKSMSNSDFVDYDLEKATAQYNNERQGKPLQDSISEAERQKRLEEANYEKENGNTNVKNKKWKEAIECYSRAISRDDKNPIFFANRALCYLKIERYEEASKDCTAALELDPNYVKAYLRRGSSYISLNEPEHAITDLSMAVKLEPANKEARKCLAEAKMLKTKLEARDNSTIVAISKAHHERSKAPLKRINIEEIGKNVKPQVLEKEQEVTERPTSLKLSRSSNSVSSSRSTPRTPVTPLEKQYLTEIPEAPTNSVQFLLSWGQLRPEDHYKYLSKIPGGSLPKIFGDSLESGILSEVLKALSSAEEADIISEYLNGLSETNRFLTLSLFMSAEDRNVVTSLIQKALECKHITKEEAEDLRKKFAV